MKEELEKLNRWLIETKNMNIQPQIDEYLEKFKKHVLSKNLFGITTSNVYQKIFGFPKDHSTAIYWRDQEFTLDDLRLYQSLHKFLDNKEIVWEK